MSKNHRSLISWTGVKSTLSLENFSQKIRKYILDLSRSIKKQKKINASYVNGNNLLWTEGYLMALADCLKIIWKT